MRKQFRQLIDVDEALGVIETLALSPQTEEVPLEGATGRRLAASIGSPIDVPGFDRSIMDGYAVRAADTVGAYDDDPVSLTYAGAIPAGREPETALGDGDALEIATGAVIPPGADAVVMVERTSRRDESVDVYRPVAPGENVMARSADIALAETVLRRGDRLDPRRIGLLAALGIDVVTVEARPRVAVISTGAEIVRPGERVSLEPGEIYDINSFAVAAAIESIGAEPVIYPHAEGDYAAIRETVTSAAGACGAVVTSGSTSASAEDVVYRVIEDAGELLVHGVAAKPGKPTAIGEIGGTPVLGLPGNPISALMNFRLFGEPLLADAIERDRPGAGTIEATLATSVDSVAGRVHLLPVGLVEDPARGLLAYDVEKGSGAITSLAAADGYLTIAADLNYLAAADTVEVTLLEDGISPPAVLLGGEACAAIDRHLDDHPDAVRWLAQGSIVGARRLREGILDVAAIDLPAARLDELELVSVERVGAYERRVGFVHRGLGDVTTADGLLERAGTIAATPPETGLRCHLDDRLGEQTVLTVRGEANVLRAVVDGDADAGFVTAVAATGTDLTFLPVAWTRLDLFVAAARADKPAVGRLVDAIATSTDLPDGTRPADDVGR